MDVSQRLIDQLTRSQTQLQLDGIESLQSSLRSSNTSISCSGYHGLDVPFEEGRRRASVTAGRATRSMSITLDRIEEGMVSTPVAQEEPRLHLKASTSSSGSSDASYSDEGGGNRSHGDRGRDSDTAGTSDNEETTGNSTRSCSGERWKSPHLRWILFVWFVMALLVIIPTHVLLSANQEQEFSSSKRAEPGAPCNVNENIATAPDASATTIPEVS